jgi:uncharacterized protein YbaA (DUF1428 family)
MCSLCIILGAQDRLEAGIDTDRRHPGTSREERPYHREGAAEVRMSYVDGFVIAVPKKNLKAYVRMARLGEKVWRKHGALDYKECVGDDLKPKWGLPFPRLMKLKPGETAVFSYIVYKSRAHRDRVNAKVMKEMEKSGMPPEMPFDVKRMAYGGFEVRVGG